MTSFKSASDILTLLVPLGYLAYDSKTKEVFIPKRKSSKPALLVELKWDQSAKSTIRQIKDKKYTGALRKYKGNLLLVGINYDKAAKAHQCIIEKALDAYGFPKQKMCIWLFEFGMPKKK